MSEGDVLPFERNGRSFGATRAQVKPVRCSNELCDFHTKDAVFKQESLVHLMIDVLQPGKMAPVMMGVKFFCLCGWVFTPDTGDGKAGTIPPEMDPNTGKLAE